VLQHISACTKIFKLANLLQVVAASHSALLDSVMLYICS